MRVGILGLGIMGSRMAANVAAAPGLHVGVWNRTPDRAREWNEQHPGWIARSPAELARRCDVLVSMVVDGPQVQALVADAGPPAGLLWIDCSTIGPAAAQAIGRELDARGASMLDAPVTGSAPRAADGTLTIMAGGTDADYERGRPVLEAMGQLVLHVGRLGSGQAIKLINNAVAAANTLTVAEALRVGAAAGVDQDALVAVMESGSGGSTALSLKHRAIREQSYEPALFKLEHMLKDVLLCLELAPFPSAERAREALARATAQGRAAQDFSALAEG